MKRIDYSNIRKIGSSNFILIPAKLFNDKAFPLKLGDNVIIETERNQMIIKKVL